MANQTREAQLVDMDDQALKDYVGYLWESVKRLSEAMDNDATLQTMVDAVREYKQEHYLGDINNYRARLKAARQQAQVRGLVFEVPEALT